ncbi:hypothetical protein CK203_108907 [Vitis vinifera]|uniref:Uncharacterized protein n=1 Tax=Vitis vinifera TaxID=29760 RepID=A0A438DGX2_VITVI|nr:hypothetical protein CK203_108907 [Vitis vinifera]
MVSEDAEELVRVPLQGILLADSFAQKFCPKVLPVTLNYSTTQGTSPCDHVAGHLGSTWHPSISIRTNITKSEYPIWIKSTSGQLCGVPLKLRSAFRVGGLPHTAPYRLQAEVTGEPSVKKSSQHRGDTIPDPIKVLLQLKIKVLLPLVNVPMIAWLESAGIEEVFVFCCAHSKQVINYLENSNWFSHTILSLRLIYERHVECLVPF